MTANLFRVLILAAFSVGSSVHAERYYVAPGGNDQDPGTLAQPFATLQRAQLAARKAAGHEAVTVQVRAGTYYLPETWVFTPADSGAHGAAVVYQAFPNERPVISGGVPMPDLEWKPYQDGILQAQVPAGFVMDQFFVNGELQSLARYPNFDLQASHFHGAAADAISPERAARWRDPTGGFIHALHGNEWGGMHYRITGKGADNKITFEGGWQNNRASSMHAKFRFVENVFEELDAVGEWFLDSNKQTLYYRPAPGVDLTKATLVAVRLKRLVEFQGTEQAPVRFVSFKGLTFRHAARTFMETKEPLLRSDWTIYRGGALFLNGVEDCEIEDCVIEQVGGNAVFVNNYNRRVAIRGCHLRQAGGSGVLFIGDPQAVRNPLYEYGQRLKFADIDQTPGPRNQNYPADCVVEDCLIHEIGEVEKQTAGVTVDMAQRITIRHCSIYDMPRSGINFGDGCWGGHLIEFCDVFDTVKETGDHGSFNSWGRDRYWGLDGLDLNDDKSWELHKAMVTLDACETNTIRNSRWRCDHGWDIDLDDGSSNYHIYNNLFLRGGLKNREGFYRTVENNIMVNNGFHPHVWYKHSEDSFRRNIMGTDHYLPAGGMPSTPWGREMNHNLVHRDGVVTPQPAEALAQQSKRDEHSLVADALFVDPAAGDFRVRDGSPALKLGFVNFPMDQFGVRKPSLKAVARTPEIPALENPVGGTPAKSLVVKRENIAWQATVRDIKGLSDRSAYGLPDESGVLLVDVPVESVAAKAGLQKDDVILACREKPVRTVLDLHQLWDQAAGRSLVLRILRQQKPVNVELKDYAYVVSERLDNTAFKTIPLASAADAASVKVTAGGAPTNNDAIESLVDGKVANSYGPIFANGVVGGMYKLDLGAVTTIAQVNTFTALGSRSRQNFLLYGSRGNADPGWNVADRRLFTPVMEVAAPSTATYQATSIRASSGRPLGNFRWLVWAVFPDHADRVLENSAIQELQVIPAAVSGK